MKAYIPIRFEDSEGCTFLSKGTDATVYAFSREDAAEKVCAAERFKSGFVSCDNAEIVTVDCPTDPRITALRSLVQEWIGPGYGLAQEVQRVLDKDPATQ